MSTQLPDQYGVLNIPRFYHPDGLGSVHHLTDAAGAVTDQYEFNAFGSQWYSNGHLVATTPLRTATPG